jgi:DNA-binding response OmpR family regulator
LLAYKDIQLNMGDFSYRIAPKEDFDSLSNLEFKLLRLFVKNPNKCFNRNELIEHIWDRMKVASRTVDSQISRLRKRLNDSECQIESVYGGGYRLI